jgi:hypothetical protein
LPCNLEYYVTDDILIKSASTNLYITLTKIHATLKYFYPDYKNYYYLPNEDYAIHKSVGQYVDKEHRQTAKASNCYIKKEGIFIPLPSHIDSSENKFNTFKTEYTNKSIYTELNNSITDNMNDFAYYLTKNIFMSL